MGIVDEDVVRVREAADIVKVMSGYTQLKKVGRNWMAVCPIHGEKTPSLSVNAEKGVYHCFGCQASGDVITFVREMEHTDFVGAVERLANQFGITLRYTDQNEGESRKQRARLLEAMRSAVDFYHQRLIDSPDAGAARRYLRDRGFDGDTVRAYRMGWAPDDWDVLAKHLRVSDKVLQDSGLGLINRRGRQQDVFRARILFPIFDVQGEPVAFGGRKLPDGEGPKYRNSSETALYSKSKVLYGLNWAKDAVVKTDQVIVCEGYTDVIGFARAGVPRAVATCGTALTEEHVRLLTRFAHKVVLAFDPDAAGQAAAERFYEWERKYEVEVAVADLPAGQDPGDLALADPERLVAAVSDRPPDAKPSDVGVRPFLGFRVDRVLAAGDLSSPEGRGRAAERAMATIAEHPSPLVRDQYLMQVADRCRLQPDQLRSLAGTGASRSAPPRVERPRRPADRDTPETEALRVLTQRPTDLEGRLDEVLFDDDVHVRAFRALQATGDVRAALDATDPDAAELLARVAVEDTETSADDVVILLLRDATRRALAELEQEMRAAADPLGYGEAIAWLKRQLDTLQPDDPPGRDAESQLLGWLRHRAEEMG